ncbi:MAG: toprim domain-containing protein [Rhodocyclales bacterium]|nr:toprim domain-containing protein [Rhodocyclales bacterium]
MPRQDEARRQSPIAEVDRRGKGRPCACHDAARGHGVTIELTQAHVNDALDQFAAFIAARGILPERIDADGLIHRCKIDGGKSGRLDGAYVLHIDGHPAGGFINWRDGLGWQTWSATSERVLSREEKAAARARMEVLRQVRQQEEAQRHAEAAERAARLLGRSHPATSAHPYLRRKGVQAYAIFQLRDQLVIPVRDVAGALSTLQFISPAGDKRFLTGGRQRGCYFAIGRPREALCLAEGYATAASIFEATGHATAVAFHAGNLEPVARALRAKFPGLPIIICADNDSATPGNPGVTHAMAAARAVRGVVAVPDFEGSTS